MKQLGIDRWIVKCHHHSFFKICKRENLDIYDIHCDDDYVEFSAPIYQRRYIVKCFEDIEWICSKGLLKYVYACNSWYRIVGIILGIFIFMICNQMIIRYDIQGDHIVHSKIQKVLKKKYKLPLYSISIQQLKSDILNSCKNMSWIECSRNGNVLEIQYQLSSESKILKNQNMILKAQQDGVIAYYDVDQGVKQKAIHEYVSKGDILVSDVLLDSANKTKKVGVKGRVFAYTFKDITLTRKKALLPRSYTFFEMLVEARNILSDQLLIDDEVLDENILQFSNELGTIKMVIHYRLLQDISTPKGVN